MATSKKPTGLTIDRNGNKYIFKWKKGESYGDGQQLSYYFYPYSAMGINIDTAIKWSSIIKLSGSASSYTVTAPAYTVMGVIFRVRGNHDQNSKDPGWSAWVSKTFLIKEPAKPTVTATWNSGTPNKTIFTYKATDEEHKPFTQVRYRTKWITDYNGKPESYTWSGAYSSSSSKTGTLYNSTESITPSISKTRVVQCWSVGKGGASDYVFKYHTYAQPYKPIVKKAKGVANAANGTICLNMEWSVQSNAAHPIDKTTVQYLITTPDTGMSVPPGDSFTDGDTPVGRTKWAEDISGSLSTDQVLFARIKVEHDTRETYSDPAIALKGKLATPTSVSIVPNQVTHTIVVNATNASTVPDSFMAVLYQNGDTKSVLGIIPHGSSTVSMIVPPWTDDAGNVGVYAVVGSSSAQAADSDGVVIYTITPQMTSPTVWKGTLSAPTVTVTQADIEETATVSWTWADEDATGAEVSWADHPDAWESTDEPETFNVDASKASRLNVSSLEPGIMWYFRVRLYAEGSDETSYGLYSDTVALNLASAPAVPVLELADTAVAPDGQTIASWVYVSGDNTPQAHATIATYASGVYTPILQVDELQSAVIDPAALGWSVGDYLLAVQVESESGRFSEWSDTTPITVADPLVCIIASTSLVSKTVTIDGDSVTFPYCLDAMPLSVTVTGAGDTGQTVLMIKRKSDYAEMRPDESQLIGYADEVICQYVYTGESAQTITIDDVQGKLNDGATYYLEATVTDRLGRVSTDRYPADDPADYFKVIWNDQAIMPEATVTMIDNDYAMLTISKPVGAQAGDVIDVYRLTSEKPQIILRGVQMDSTPVVYVDPFPAIGANGGYRFVYRTANGDSIINDADFAWLDVSGNLSSDGALIDFNGQRIDLGYNLKFSNSWKKDFQETRYLGGSIKGDWTAGVARTGSIDSVTVPVLDNGTFVSLRRLAEYEGICHVRTMDGAVITADVQVGDDFGYDTAGKIQTVKLTFTRVDPVELDGQLLSDWSVSQ